MVKEAMVIAQADFPIAIDPKMLNRHGLITGATGTGKTVSVKVLIEALSDLGVPTFFADIKGDVSGLVNPGGRDQHVVDRIESLQLNDFTYRGYPTEFWDVFGEHGIPVRATVSQMGPILLSKLLELNDTQTSVLVSIFRYADDQGYAILDFKDLRAMIQHVSENATMLDAKYGSIPAQSVGAISRKLLVLEDEGAELFFGEPSLDINDWFKTVDEKGVINILHSVRLYQSPSLYATFLLWMLSTLFEILPEVGDLDQPKMVFFFDEAHLLFKDMPKVLVDRIERVVKLIRSKGVGVFFISQTPSDIPDQVLGQLGNRIQHALRAYTPQEQKALKAAAQSYRSNPDFDTASVISELGIGEVLISTIDAKGVPTIVERAWMMPPHSDLTPIDDGARTRLINASVFNEKYKDVFDRHSAYEMLEDKMRESAHEAALQAERDEIEAQRHELQKEREKLDAKNKSSKRRPSTRQTPLEKAYNSTMTTIGREVGRFITRNIMGILVGGAVAGNRQPTKKTTQKR